MKTLIAGIGKVKHPESKDAIQEARIAYDGLTEKQKELVDNYDALTEAEEAYAGLDHRCTVSARLGWVVFALVILELIYLALYFLLWFPKAAAIAEKCKLTALKPLLAKIVLFGFIDLLLLIGSAASVVIFVLALAALCVYAQGISVATFVLAFLVLAAYALILVLKNKGFFKAEETVEEESKAPIDSEVIEVSKPLVVPGEEETLGFYRITKDKDGRCSFALFNDEKENLSREMGVYESEKAAYFVIKKIREKGENVKAENRLRGNSASIPAPKFVMDKDERGVFTYFLVDKDGSILLHSVQYLNENRCMKDLLSALTCVTTEEITVVEGKVKGDPIPGVPAEEKPKKTTKKKAKEEPAPAAPAQEAVAPAEEKKEVAADKAEEKVSLKENFAAAKEVTSNSKINKNFVTEALKELFADKVESACRGNLTKTGLPLADTHYALGKKRVCFAYVYEVGETAMLLLKVGDEYGAALAEKHPLVKKSAFPKSKASWYSVILDDTFTEKEIKEILKNAADVNLD